MAESDYDGDDSFDTPKVAENGDPTGTFWENSFKPAVNRTKYLSTHKGNLVGGNAWQGNQTFDDGTTTFGVDAPVVHGGGVTDTTLVTKSGAAARTRWRSIATGVWSGGALRVSPTVDHYRIDEPSSGGAADGVITLNSTSSVGGHVVPLRGEVIHFYNWIDYSTYKVQFKNEAGTVLATFPVGGGSGMWVDFIFTPEASWTVARYGGGATKP